MYMALENKIANVAMVISEVSSKYDHFGLEPSFPHFLFSAFKPVDKYRHIQYLQTEEIQTHNQMSFPEDKFSCEFQQKVHKTC
jgi:hypothetical protein